MNQIIATPDSIAACGLYCGACRKFCIGKCPGCKNNEKASWCKIYSNVISKVFALLFNSDRPACISYINGHGETAYAEEMSKRKCQTIKRK